MLSLESIPEDGMLVKCSDCNSSFQIIRETFSHRALRKGSEIFCISCGSSVGNSTSCSVCGQPFPDYHAVEPASAAGKQAKKFISFFTLSRSSKLGRAGKKDKLAASSQSVSLSESGSKATSRGRRLVKTIFVALVVFAILTTGGAFYYLQQKEAKYADIYVKAIYGLKAGTDLNLKYCSKLAADWKKSMDSGQNVIPRLTPAELSLLSSSKTEVEKRMQQSADAPEKFIKNQKSLTKLFDTYKKSYALVSTPAANMIILTETANKLSTDFGKDAEELKKNLPSSLANELAKGKQKYRELKDF